MVLQDIDFYHPYLTSNIIAYIGNKRGLLPLIYRAVTRCVSDPHKKPAFLDLFAGSGAVSKLAKYLGFSVVSNDWEVYSWILMNAFVGIDKADLENMYREKGGIEEVLRYLNSLPPPPLEEQYIARYYAPEEEDPQKADYRRERLFYTRENGLRIDAVRNEIERLYPEPLFPVGAVDAALQLVRPLSRREKEKQLLIGLLLYEAATHTNTSGVFKAYHRGFGGYSGDALCRILAPVQLEYPVLVDSSSPSRIVRSEASALARRLRETEEVPVIAYIDPPYNQHQYGSNYHLLKTIALWDKPAVDNSRSADGRFTRKAAIREDWTDTRSAYCYREKARRAFEELLENLEAEYLLISYSTEGIIPFEELREMCAKKGKLDIVTNEYTTYRGGKQSITRLNRNIEFVLIVDTHRSSLQADRTKIDALLHRKRVGNLLKRAFRFSSLVEEFEVDEKNGTVSTEIEGQRIVLSTDDFFRLRCFTPFEELDTPVLTALEAKLNRCICKDKIEELEELFIRIEQNGFNPLYFVRMVPHTLKKLAHKKYRKEFEQWLARTKLLQETAPELYAKIENKIDALETVAEKRFS